MSILTRRQFNATLARVLGAVALACPDSFSSAANARNKKNKRPNFVFICSDRHSSKYVGYMGHPHVKTPHLDRIAKQGVFFTNHYAGNPNFPENNLRPQSFCPILPTIARRSRGEKTFD